MPNPDKPPPSQEAHARMSVWLRLSKNTDFDFFLSVIEERIEGIRNGFEISKPEHFLLLQGAIKELRWIKSEVKSRFAEAQNNLT